MIVEGLKLAIIGILFVYTFLSLLVWIMHISATVLRRYTQQEEREQAVRRKKASTGALLQDVRLAAVIAAAIASHRKDLRGRA